MSLTLTFFLELFHCHYFFICLWKVSGKLTMNVCSCGMCSPIARAFTFSSLGAVLPFMMFIWCSCSEEKGFICFFSSSLILFLSSASNLLLLSDFPLWAAFYALLLFTGTELQRLWDRIHSPTWSEDRDLPTNLPFDFRKSYKLNLGDSRCLPC